MATTRRQGARGWPKAWPSAIDVLRGPRAARRRREQVSIEDEADEGLQLALRTVRFRLKNRIIVGSLRDGVPMEHERYAASARLELGSLATEAERAALRMIDTAAAAELASGAKFHEHDYRHDDAGNLIRREAVYRALARRLRAVRTHPDEVTALVEAARTEAWDEVSRSIELRLGVPPGPSGEEPSASEVADRVRRLIEVDLAMLFSTRSAPPR